MSKSVQKILKNSFFQTFNILASAGMNFFLMLVYARILGPENLGALVTSQAQVLIWIIVIDLGMTAGLIAALNKAEFQKESEERQGFRAFDLIKQVLLLRLIGASLGAVAICFLSYRSANAQAVFNSEQFLQNIAYIPYLFGFALHYTAASYAMFRGRQATYAMANLLGIAATIILALILAFQSHPIRHLLLAQSWGGFLSAAVIVASFIFFPEKLEKENSRVKKNSMEGSFWKKNALRALMLDVWPHTIVLAVTTIWQRMDQIAATHLLGNEAGGQYALAIRLVSIPIMVAAAVHLALFPDLQRVGRDAPEKIKVYVGAISKFLFRYGLVMAAILMGSVASILIPLLPKFQPALVLFPWFLPGVAAYWIANILIGSLFGVRRYKEIAMANLIALLGYGLLLQWLTTRFGLYGVIVSFNVFTILLFSLSYFFARKISLLDENFSFFAKFSEEESLFLAGIRAKFTRIFKFGSGKNP